jgi:hypothetical protein
MEDLHSFDYQQDADPPMGDFNYDYLDQLD